MSFAAGVLSAALALPPQGLVAAYDFGRTNFINWSEDLTQGSWTKTSMTAAPSAIRHPEGLPFWNLTENTTNADHRADQGIPVVPDGLFIAEFDMARLNRDAVSFGFGTSSCWVSGLPAFSINLATGQTANLFPSAPGSSVTAYSLGGGVYRVRITARMASAPVGTPTLRFWTGVAATSQGDGVSGLAVTRVKLNVNQEYDYERITDAQVLLDRSVRLWPAPAARTNFVNWSEDFTQGGWNKAGCTVNGGVTITASYKEQPVTLARYTATNGSQSGNGLTGGGGGPGLPVTTGQMVYASVFVSPIDSPSTGIVISSGATQLFVTFNFAARTFTDMSGVAASTQYELLPGGVYRLTVGWVATGTMTVRTHVGYVLGLTSVYIGGASMSAGLNYEKQAEGTAPDYSLRGRNVANNSWMTRPNNTSLPTGWSVQTPTGGSTTYSYGTDERGIEYLEVTLTMGTSSGAFNLYFTGQATAGLTYVTGQSYSVGLDMTQVSGPPAALGINAVHVWGPTGAYVGTSSGGATQSHAMPSGPTPSRCTTIAPITLPAVAGAAYFTARAGVVAGLTGDSSVRVYRFARPQVEPGASLGPFIHTPAHASLGSVGAPDSSDPTWTMQGLQFDGVDDYASLPVAGLGSQGTVMLAVKMTLTSTARAFALGSGGLNGRLTLYASGPNTLTADWTDAGGTARALSVTVAEGAWVLLECRWNNDQLMLSQWGGPKSTVASNFTAFRPTVLNLGNATTAIGLQRPMNGTLGYFGLWNRALTDAEITQAYRFIRNQLSRRGVTI